MSFTRTRAAIRLACLGFPNEWLRPPTEHIRSPFAPVLSRRCQEVVNERKHTLRSSSLNTGLDSVRMRCPLMDELNHCTVTLTVAVDLPYWLAP
jgi:hypothetical protein